MAKILRFRREGKGGASPRGLFEPDAPVPSPDLTLRPDGRASDARPLGPEASDAVAADEFERAGDSSPEATRRRRRRRNAFVAGLVAVFVAGVFTAIQRKDGAPPEEPALLVERAADRRLASTGAALGVAFAEAQNLARDLSNEPPNALPPATLAREAEKAARAAGVAVRELAPAELRKRGFGALLAVAQGSANEPRVIVLEHGAPPRATKKKVRGARRPTVCLVGKGVCFDSGGLSLKPSASMTTMKHDMSGGAAVIATLCATAKLSLLMPEHFPPQHEP